MTRLLFTVLLLASACGGKKSSSPVLPPDPAWVKDYEIAAKDACACKDSACLEAAKSTLDAVVAEHGGFDQVSPTVHQAHSTFDKCWRAGTTDPNRDLNDAADRICQCLDSACVAKARLSLLQLQDRYGIDAAKGPSKDLSAEQNATLERLTGCYAAVTVSAADYLAARIQTTSALCECTELGCVQGAGKIEAAALKGKLVVADRLSIQNDLDTLQSQHCECLGRVLKKANADQAFGAIPVSVDLAVSCK